MKSVSDIITQALAAGQNTLSEYDSKRILVEYGIPTTQELLIDEFTAAEQAAEQIGYPVLIRPSYVLGGRAMEIVHDTGQLERYIDTAVKVSGRNPVLIDQFF